MPIPGRRLCRNLGAAIGQSAEHFWEPHEEDFPPRKNLQAVEEEF